MNFEEIKKLIDDMGESKIDELNIEFPDGIKISMKKDRHQELEKISFPIKEEVVIKQNISDEKTEEENYHIIKSPMVGTFYSKSSPQAEPYAQVGKKVKKGDILCIVEAMKLMNEIESEIDGEIVEVCVQDGQMVDYGKSLFKIK